jgi:putative cell wall-binding protein
LTKQQTPRWARRVLSAVGILMASVVLVVPTRPTGAAAQTDDGCGNVTSSRYQGTEKYAVSDDQRVAGVLRTAGLAGVLDIGGGVVTFGGTISTADAALRLAGVHAQLGESHRLRWHATPNDPAFPQQWSLRAVGAQKAWDITKGSTSVLVADLDSGVDATHPDLAGKLIPGWDATAGAPLPAGNSDEGGHGTGVVGVIGAATDDGGGIASLGWLTPLMEIKIGDAFGPSSAAVIAGLRYAADHGARVANLSLGTACREQGEADAVAYAQGKGVLVVASAGNEAQSGNPVEYPAAFPGVIAVGATGPENQHASYSNTGSQVSISAPGGVGDSVAANEMALLAVGGGTTNSAGTSYSSPLVAAAAALVLAKNPTMTGAEAGDRLLATARDLGAPGKDPVFGAGLLDISAAVGGPATTTPATPPRAPGTISRVFGPDRIATAVAISQASFPSQADAVVLARADVFADALAGAPLATAKGGPILLTRSDALDSRVSDELRRLLPAGRTVYVLGGTSALNDTVVQALQSRGYNVSRFAGVNRFETAALIAERELPTSKLVYLADGTTFGDAMIASAAAAQFGGVLILTNSSSMPARSAAYLDAHSSSYEIAVGPFASNASSADEFLAGDTLYDTGRIVLETHGGTTQVVGIASGLNFADGLAAGPFIAAQHGFILPTLPDILPSETAEALTNHRTALNAVHIFGGPAAISEGVQSEIDRVVHS